ncbi:hypothetical protein [Pontibacter pamirensis]|uniref:hypothetical protein n=1 Tax=Pontibacter pamirensis TaxID=2562824 RepID=UPI0013895D8D|nr:hypothetical protein [Pontibacter pamirensis]
MKKLNLVFLLLFLYSCADPCEDLECLSEDAFAFTFKSKDNGEDLLFGDDPQISKDDVEVFYMVNGTKEPAHVQFQPQYIVVNLNDDVQEYFVRALDKTDTLSIQSFRRAASECCPSITEVEKISLNGKEAGRDSWILDLYR